MSRRGGAAAAAMLLAIVGCGDPPDLDSPEPASEVVSEAPAPTTPLGPQHSTLWGVEGELWSPTGRLPDFSHAGYRQGEVPLPEPPVVADVTDFGAVADDGQDDTDAFLAALDAAANEAASTGRPAAVFVPEGRFRLTRILELSRGVVLRGAARDRTILYFPESLFDVYGEGTIGGPFGWSWGGAWIWARGELGGAPMTKVTQDAARGDDSIVVESVAGIAPGQRVRLVQIETGDGSATLHLHAGFPLGGRCQVERPGQELLHWVVRVEAVDPAERRVFFDRPLRVDVRPQWQAHLQTFEATVSEVGVEHLTVEFPETPQAPHHQELGYNAIELERVIDGWVRDVAIVNSDNAIQFWYSRYSTAQQILITGRGGHYAVNFGGTQDCLATEIRIESVSFHDLSFANLGNGSVISKVVGPFLNFDQHRGAAYENLISDADVGASWQKYRLWARSHTRSGHYTAARQTFWNIRPQVGLGFIPAWPQLTIIGPMAPLKHFRRRDLDFWLERRPQIQPPDLHYAQVRRRLGTTPPALSDQPLDIRVPPRSAPAATEVSPASRP